MRPIEEVLQGAKTSSLDASDQESFEIFGTRKLSPVSMGGSSVLSTVKRDGGDGVPKTKARQWPRPLLSSPRPGTKVPHPPVPHPPVPHRQIPLRLPILPGTVPPAGILSLCRGTD